ncbi:MAG: PDR/VanB family oxidoreductase [Pseudomonadota bacterium]
MINNISVRVVGKVSEAVDICSFELASADGRPLPPFSAGSHIDVLVSDTITRQYSLCNDPAETDRYVIGVLRDPGSRGGSLAMHDAVKAGDIIEISAPKNHFPLLHAERILLFAGGIGVTPILCMAERLSAIKANFSMHYCTRSPERTAFLERIKASDFSSRVTFHHDAGPAEQRLDLPALIATPEPGTHLYVCGPAGFISHVVDTAKSLGWDSSQIHFEYFGAAPQDTSHDTGFEVKLASSGRVYAIPADRTVFQVLDEHGVDIPVSCEQGVCGTCITRVLSGTPDHRDAYFTDEERAANDQFTPCCSRSLSKLLVLDL